MLYFQVPFAQKLKTKNDFFVLPANMECCYETVKILEKNYM